MLKGRGREPTVLGKSSNGTQKGRANSLSPSSWTCSSTATTLRLLTLESQRGTGERSCSHVVKELLCIYVAALDRIGNSSYFGP
jgi:hypothetical protein